jgi:SPP1 family predicted phage head-tail adaptor
VRAMEAGLRDRLVTIQQMTDVATVSGMPGETPSTLVADMPASKNDLTASERMVLGQLSVKAEAKFVINYRLDMDPEVVDVPKARRLLYRGRTYDITMAQMIGRREGIELFTIAKVG